MPATHQPDASKPSRDLIDLTPFGFTPTESLAYSALLATGSTGGYALAKHLNIARANAYQALNGLVTKGAATLTEGRPQRFKPLRPDALFARVLEAEGRKLDGLERQIEQAAAHDGETFIALSGARAVYDMVMRTAAREEGTVACAATSSAIGATAPGWRRRRVVERPTYLWSIGTPLQDPPIQLDGTLGSDAWPDALGGVVLLMTAGAVGIGAREGEGSIGGFWTTDPLMVGLVNAALPRRP